MSTRVKGACLCGGVSLSFKLKENHYHACHCGMCRKWGGGPFLAVDASEDLKIEGEKNISTYPSSEWAERGFCKKCGTHLFYRLRGGGFCNIALGLLENPESLKFDLQIFTDKKLESYSFAEKTKMLTEAEVFANFTP